MMYALVCRLKTQNRNGIYFNFTPGLPHVREMSGEKLKFLQIREMSGNFEKMSRNFGHLTHVREFCDVMLENFKFQIQAYDKGPIWVVFM